MKNKIIVHGCGGCGANIINNVIRGLTQLGDGFPDWVINYIDSSTNNIEPINDLVVNFHEIKKTSLTASEIQGAGGDRTALRAIMPTNVKSYLDKCNIKQYQPNEFHLVVYSLGGGTGSVAGPLITAELIGMGIPTISVLIGDHGDLIKQQQSLDTLGNLSKLAEIKRKCLTTIYLSNTGSDITKIEKENNEELRNILGILSVFLSGQNLDIDNGDMMNMLDMSRVPRLSVEPGIYSLLIYSGDDFNIPEFTSLRFMRTLTQEGVDVVNPLGQDGYSTKKGFITVENALKYYNKILPLHMLTVSGYLKHEVEIYNKEITKANEKRANDKALLINTSGTVNSSLNDEYADFM